MACFPYLKYETFLLRPGIIVCLGRVAAQRIISPDFKITRQHGTWTYRKNCALTATYHPSAILRDPSKYEEVKRDFQEVVYQYYRTYDPAAAACTYCKQSVSIV